MIFTQQETIRFRHTDPAGIVFYPRYAEMVNDLVEDWSDKALGYSFATQKYEFQTGMPTVRFESEFMRPSRMGDVVTWKLMVTDLGRSSVHLLVTLEDDREMRLLARSTIVHSDFSKDPPSAKPWPADVRARIKDYLVEDADPFSEKQRSRYYPRDTLIRGRGGW